MKKATTIIISLLVIFSINGFAQQQPILSQYHLNKCLINPSAAGINSYTNISLASREQWAGVYGSPTTHFFIVDSRILENSFISKSMSIRKKKKRMSRIERIGWGGLFYYDKNGHFIKNGFKGSYAYHLPTDYGQVSFGLSLSLTQIKLDRDVELGDEVPDIITNKSFRSASIPDADFGMSFTADNYYAGLSIQNLAKSNLQIGRNELINFDIRRMFYVYGGYTYKYQNYVFDPHILIKTRGAGTQIEIGNMITYKDNYWGGITYRSGSSLGVNIGARYDKYALAYAFDYNLSPVVRNSFGSHEILILIQLGENARRYKWLDRY